MQPVSLRELIAAIHGQPVGIDAVDVPVDRIETDSRDVRPGDVFWALIGQNDDGHHYLQQALRQGAVACVVEAERLTDDRQQMILVEDTLLALWDFAEWYRRQFDALVIGVTGSVGKTTTRHMVHTVLGQQFVGVESPRNFNNHFGVPLSLLQLGSEHEYAVIELAASQVGEIADLASIAHPEVGLITAIGPAHLDEFGSLEQIVQTKGELVAAIPGSGFAVLNGDDTLVRQLAARAACPVIFVGEQRDNDLVAQWVRSENGQLRFQVDSTSFDVPVVGRHHLTSAMMAIAIGRQIDMSDAEIAAGLRSYRPVSGRSELLHIGPWLVVDDTYNANPLSMLAACQTLQDWQGANKRILVTGDMLSLGNASDEYHQQLGQFIAHTGINQLVAVGSQAALVAGSAKEHGMDAGCLGVCGDVETARMLLDCWLEPGDVILVKGSRNMQMEQFVNYLKQRAAAAEQPQRRVA
ncbi:MAG: UDP-N-acetylmuramoyl-tripeptide--D-alanyl-D-alanine ligase [Planctomycetaceae bacterium]|nr:UDP-N-acetylmuramoyl-tripeptide--D-alanyl-D-alanine ligase [Planctomycetaceae bacterium]